MSNLLVINSSASGEASVSRHLVEAAVAAIVAASPGVQVVRRELGQAPVPHLTADTLAGVRGTPVTPAEHEARAMSDQLIAELRTADTILIGAPMYNFSLPTTLRAWFDHVLRAGETFTYSEAGPKGLLSGKRVIVVESRGGFYSEGPGQIADFQEPYLRHLLGFIGLTDITFIRAEKIGFGPEARAAAIAGAETQIRAATRALAAQAA